MDVQLESNVRRIPVSLKVELDDMWYNFLKPLRENRKLSDMIMTLLRSYYEDTEIRKMIDYRIIGLEEIEALNREIDRIAMEHNLAVVQTSAVKFQTAYGVSGGQETPESMANSLRKIMGAVEEPIAQPEFVDFDNIEVPDFEAEVKATWKNPMRGNPTESRGISEPEDEIDYSAIFDEDPIILAKSSNQTSKQVVPDFNATLLTEPPTSTSTSATPTSTTATSAPTKKKVPASFATFSMSLEG